PSYAVCLRELGIQVFIDTFATHGIREPIGRDGLDAFSPQAFDRLLAEPATPIIVAESHGHLIGFAQIKLPAAHPMLGVST
ncbi:GNAT family N-acetyltransferase, partial [Pseudomonas syringae pv. tagetis]